MDCTGFVGTPHDHKEKNNYNALGSLAIHSQTCAFCAEDV